MGSNISKNRKNVFRSKLSHSSGPMRVEAVATNLLTPRNIPLQGSGSFTAQCSLQMPLELEGAMGQTEEEEVVEKTSKHQHIVSKESTKEISLPQQFPPPSQNSTTPELLQALAKLRKDSLVPQTTSTRGNRTSIKTADTATRARKSTPQSMTKYGQKVPESTERPITSTTRNPPNQSEVSSGRRNASTETMPDCEANGLTLSTFPTQEDSECRDDGTGLIVTVHRRERFRQRALRRVLKKCRGVSGVIRKRRVLWR